MPSKIIIDIVTLLYLSGFNASVIAESDVFYEFILKITSFSTLKTSFTSDQQQLINQAQTFLKLAVSSFNNEVRELNLSISKKKVSLFTSFQSKIQSVNSILTAIQSNVTSGINATVLTAQQTLIMVDVVANLTSFLDTLGNQSQSVAQF